MSTHDDGVPRWTAEEWITAMSEAWMSPDFDSLNYNAFVADVLVCLPKRDETSVVPPDDRRFGHDDGEHIITDRDTGDEHNA